MAYRLRRKKGLSLLVVLLAGLLALAQSQGWIEMAGKGVVTHNGRMIENMHVDNARRLITLSDAIAGMSAG